MTKRKAESQLSDPEGYARLERMVADRKKREKEQGQESQTKLPTGMKPILPELRQFMHRHKIPMSAITTEPARDLEAEEKARQADKLIARRATWRAICPPKFWQTFDMLKVNPSVDRQQVLKVLNWEFEPKGLFIAGETGRSKTWAMMQRLEQATVEERKKVKIVDGVQFATEASEAFQDPSRTINWLKTYTEPDILAIDDLAKRFTPAAQEAWFAVLDRRSAHCRPILATSNVDGDELREMVKDCNLAEPMIRRIRDSMEIVVL